MPKKTYHRWTKKLGDTHYSSHNNTLCGIPMLGNNYSNVRTAPICKECLKIAKKNELLDNG